MGAEGKDRAFVGYDLSFPRGEGVGPAAGGQVKGGTCKKKKKKKKGTDLIGYQFFPEVRA